jgi:hypothetical protein
MFSLVFMKVGWLCLVYRTLTWVRMYRWPMRGLSWSCKCWSARGCCEHESAGPPKGMYYPSSAGTLTPLKRYKRLSRGPLPPYLNDPQ